MEERRGKLEKAARNGLYEEDIFILRRCLSLIERLDVEIVKWTGG